MKALTDRQTSILLSLRDNRSNKDVELLNAVINGRLAPNDIQRVCEIINDEYLMKGIDEDYSPNDYGRELESLLNQVNAARLA